MGESELKEVGRLLSQSRLNKETTVKLLKQAESGLSELRQSPSLRSSLNPLCNALSKPTFLQHKDKDIKLLLAVCFSEIMRILAPDPPFTDDVFKEIFRIFIGTFTDLGDTKSPFLPRRLKILENVSALRCSIIMLDIGSDNLVLEMFKTFFSVAKQEQNSIFQAMLSIITHIIEEKISQPLLDIILKNLVREEKGGPYKLASLVIEKCGEKLEPLIRNYLISCISNVGDCSAKLHHRVILEVFRSSPKTLYVVIPRLTHELLAENVDIRLEAVQLISQLLSLSNLKFAQDYNSVFLEFLNRFSDKSADIRIAALESVKCLTVNSPLSNEANEILEAIGGRLLDFEDKARIQAVSVICQLAKSNIISFPSEFVLQATERLRDKKVLVRKNVMQKLLELYRYYCDKCSKGVLVIDQNYEQIPCKILLLCFDKDSEAFRPKNLEHVLAEELFPLSLSSKERANHWIVFFSLFTQAHIKALSTILSQKKRLQSEMQVYLAQRLKDKEGSDEETQKRILTCFNKMSVYFPDASKACEFFNNLHQMKDNNIFKDLSELCNENTTFDSAKSLRELFLKRIGSKNQSYNFFKALSWKCSYSIINSEIIQCILTQMLTSQKYIDSTFELLHVISNIFPSLFKGSEESLLEFLSEDSDLANEKCLQILAKSSQYLSLNLSDIYPLLETKCLEGTRIESKHAIHILSSLIYPSDNTTFSNLFKKVIGTLNKGQNGNIATLLQSLGQIARFYPSTFDNYEKQIFNFIIKKIICSNELVPLSEEISSCEAESCSFSCKIKIFGIKALVKCYTPNKITNVRNQMKDFFAILSDIILEEGIFNSISISEYDKPYLRAGASKSILKLATRLDPYISPKLFSLTILRAKDSSHIVRRSFINKLYSLLKENKIPYKYTCAFSFSSTDSISEIRTNSLRYLTEVLKETGKKYIANQNNSGAEKEKITNHPAYIVIYLIHILAHNENFPFEESQDEDSYAEFSSPLIVMLKMLLDSDIFKNNNNENIGNIPLFMLGIFRAIQKAEDSIDPNMTHKLHELSKIGEIMTKLLNKGCKLSSESLRILLPSTYYKVCTNNSEYHSSSGNYINEAFVKRILKAHDISTPKDSNEFVMKKQSSDAPKTRSRKRSLNDEKSNQSAKIHNNNNNNNGAKIDNSINNDNDNNNSQKDKASSCGSAGTKQDSRSLTGTQEDSRGCASLIENQILNENYVLKEKRKSGEALVGCEINLWCPFEKNYRNGIVESFNSKNNRHKVAYDNGESDLVNLDNEKWEIIAYQDKGISKFQPKDCSFKKGKTKNASDLTKSSRRKRLVSDSSSEEREASNNNESEKEYSSSDERLGVFLKKRKSGLSSKGPISAITVQKSSSLTEANQRDKRTRKRRN